MTIIKEYLGYCEKWKKEYGEKTLVLMQVGSFFESYGLLDENNKIYGSEIVKLAEINDMIIARKNFCVESSKVVMAGFGLPQLEKYVKKMQENGYTIVVYTQDTQSKNTTRSLYTIFSPGTYFSNETKELSNNITCLWINYTEENLLIKEQITIGISNIDIYTGKVSIFEFTKQYLHNPTTYDELERYISIYNPNECIIISNLKNNIIDDIIHFSSINSSKIHKIYIFDETEMGKYARNAEKQIYQKEMINKFYPKKNDEVFLDNFFNYSIAIQSFIFLLDFVYKHNPNLVSNIGEPIFENHTNRLILANHSLKQLNIISDNRYQGKFSCVGNLLNNCISPMGKRRFLYNLLNPITDNRLLQSSYDITDHLLNKGKIDKNFIWNLLRTSLNEIRDIEKLRRKLIMKKISPKDFTILHNNLLIIINLCNICSKDKILIKYLKEDIKEIKKISECLKSLIEKNFDINKAKIIDEISQEKLGNLDSEKIFFVNRNIDIELDNCYKKTLDCKQQIEGIRKFFSDQIISYERSSSKTNDFVKFHETAKTDAFLISTKRRITFLKKILEEKVKKECNEINLKYKSDFSGLEETFTLPINEIEYIPHGGNQNSIIITNSTIRQISNLISTSKNNLIIALEIFYNNFMNKFKEYNIDNLIEFIINLDILQCKCYIANEYNYCKPKIENNKSSYLNFKGLRHCLIEHLNTREIYVTNDIELGKEDKEVYRGILLYGTNAVGKTSFIKAIGIGIILAQAGLYVPASEFIYSPYKTIFTRILGNDNIFKGLSTFAVEMSELRTILQLADKNSLILGDELCSGTESDSALSIFVSSLEILHKCNCSFLFATHYHQIITYEEIISLNKLKMNHMSVLYDKQTNKLIYDRKLKEGPGESMYGLEVCKSLNLPDDFLNRAHDLRVKYNKLQNNILGLKVSNYNSKKIKNICELCKKNLGKEIHHLEYQKDALDNNFIKTRNSNFNKNHVANLINVCENCHIKLHKNNKKFIIKKTSNNYEILEQNY